MSLYSLEDRKIKQDVNQDILLMLTSNDKSLDDIDSSNSIKNYYYD